MRKNSFVNFFVLTLLVVISTNICFSEIIIDKLEDSYYIGQTITINSQVNYRRDIYGFIEYSLICGQQETSFYKSPITIKFDEPTYVNNINFVLSQNFVKDSNHCYILAKLLNHENRMLNDYKSRSFSIERNFNLTASVDKKEYQAGDIVNFKIFLNVPDESFNGATIDIIINKKLARYNVNEKFNELEYALQQDIKSGNHEVIIQVEDIFGNKDEKIINISILQTPTTIRNIMLKEIYYVNQDNTVEFRPSLYDQGFSDINDANIIIKIFDPKGNEIITDQVLSRRKFGFEISNKTAPGDYKVISRFNTIIEENNFRIINTFYSEKENKNILNLKTKEDITSEEFIEEQIENNESSIKYYESSQTQSSAWLTIWRILTVIPAIYLIYRLTKKILKNKKKIILFKHKFKTDKFYGLHKKNKKIKHVIPKKIKADPKNHNED